MTPFTAANTSSCSYGIGPAWGRWAMAALLACGGAAPVHAQTLPTQLPPGAEPGREAPRPVMPQSSLTAPPLQVPQSSAVEVPPGAKDLRFVLTEVSVEGASAFPTSTLRPLYAGLLGSEVSVAEVFEVAHAIELLYRNAGYITSRVIVPQQTIETGRFRILVVEGFVSDIVYQGDIGPARAAVEKLMADLRTVRPISIAEIERRLLLANDLPGLTVRGTLEPSPTTPGGSVILVRSERKALEGAVTLDNRASPYLNTRQLSGTFAWNTFGARADRVSLNTKTSLPTGRTTAIGASYDALVSAQGTSFSLAGSHARSSPGRELEVLDVQSQVSSLLGTVTVPLIRSRGENLRAVSQLEARDVDTDIAGTTFTQDRLRIVRAGASYDRSDEWQGITTVRGMLHQGLSSLGASANGSALSSRLNGRSDFTKLTFDLTRLQQVSPRVSLVGSLTSQYTRKPLLASEEFSLGGASFGRAFDEGEISGDKGVAATVELRYLPAGLPRNTQFYGFIDGGRAWAAEGGNPVPRAKLSSFGGGVRSGLSNKVFATLEIAKPMNTEVRTRGDKGARAFLSITAQF
ncbi:MAG: ShlB/FhaC/HecB family hemolysin secretion/activation protein [Pseudomonadota bacterium]